MTTNRIDINVWNATVYGDHPTADCIVVTGYPIVMGPRYVHTDTDTVLFSVDTDLPVDEWDDAWYEVGTEMPAEVKAIVDLQIAALSGKVGA